MKQKLLLLQDIEDLGKQGEIVSVRAGFARNFIIPERKGVIANKGTLRMQDKLQKERAIKAEKDKKESEVAAEQINGQVLSIEVKVDPDGKMYGSVSGKDIVDLWQERNIILDKKQVQLKHVIKDIGVHEIILKLKEGVTASFKLKIVPQIKSGVNKEGE
jgi:large subunit ribosomal protein L9